MPSAVPVDHGLSIDGHDMSPKPTGVIKFTNCRLVKGSNLIDGDLWMSSVSGKILNGQEILYEQRVAPDEVIDLGGRILSPGFIDVQLNGAYEFDFSVIPEGGAPAYGKGVQHVNKKLVTTGVTSYLPTLTSQRPEALPFLGPSGLRRDPYDGSESLGAHCEGPFLSPTKNGIHNPSVLQTPNEGLQSLSSCYSLSNLQPHTQTVKLITLAPELPGALSAISSLTSLGIITSIGHSEATYEEAKAAMNAGARMITHLFNAMKPLHHRNPGIFGLLGESPSSSSTTSDPASPPNPFFGIIADGIHIHPRTLQLAYSSHPHGLILVTDAMPLTGMPDGTYSWTNGSRIIKRGNLLTLEENGRIAGSCATLVECVSNFLNWTGASVPEAIKAVTETPARMLGLEEVKGTLEEGADADLCVLKEEGEGSGRRLIVEQVWKFGVKVFEKGE